MVLRDIVATTEFAFSLKMTNPQEMSLHFNITVCYPIPKSTF